MTPKSLIQFAKTDRQREVLQTLIDCDGNKTEAARQLQCDRKTIRKAEQACLNRAKEFDTASFADDPEETIGLLKEQIRVLRKDLTKSGKDDLSAKKVRSDIMKLSETTPEPPAWVVEPPTSSTAPGVPTLLASDWHWGEVVNPDEVAGVNEYNLEIAHQRAHRLIEKTVDLLNNHVVNPTYPGIIFALGGDMITGDIHEELSITNDLPVMPTIVDLIGVLQWCIETLADEFGRVFVPCVTGNHGRNTKKIQSKNRNHTNFDWLVYTMLDRIFADDERVQFHIPETVDARYRVYGHRYRLEHGDSMRGGDGMIGPIGPITRGDHKKRSVGNQIGNQYDTLIVGHFHTLMQLERFIVNGSLIGLNEYAYNNNFGYEPARQALWLTHPENGITISMPVLVQDRVDQAQHSDDWVSWK